MRKVKEKNNIFIFLYLPILKIKLLKIYRINSFEK